MKKISRRGRYRRTALITGATSDIGRAIARAFAREGWNVICHYYSRAGAARKLQKELEDFGVSCRLIRANLAVGGQISTMIDKIADVRIDSLVNNAGTYHCKRRFDALAEDDLRAVFSVNAFAPLLLSSALFESMKCRGFGRIVNISSIAAKYGGSTHSMHYGCSKMALEGVTKTLAREGAAVGVLVNTIRPGVIDTAFHKKFPKDMTKRVAMIPAKRMGSADDVARLVFYLGSDANSFITNETIAVAGGE